MMCVIGSARLGGRCSSTLCEVPRVPLGAAARLELVASGRPLRRCCRRLHTQPSAPSISRHSTLTDTATAAYVALMSFEAVSQVTMSASACAQLPLLPLCEGGCLRSA